jgi:hypothetical protein
MDIDIRVSVDNPNDVDVTDPTGLTEDAHDNLMNALSGLGFGLLDIEKVEGSWE